MAIAIVKYGPTVVDVRGTIAGTIFSRNSSGPYARSWAKSSNPRTDLQSNRREFLAACAQFWDTMTSGQRDNWDTWALLAFNERTNSVGENYFPSGFNQFCRVNTLRLLQGTPITGNTPPALATAATVITSMTVAATPSVSALATFPASEYLTTFLIVELAFARQKAAQPNKGNYRLMIIETAGTSTTKDFTAEMQATFGDPTIGSTAHARFRRANGFVVDAAPILASDLVS